VDANIVATDTGTLIEVQSTGEGATFTRSTLDTMLDVALAGIQRLSDLQSEVLAQPYPRDLPGRS
jgi:ribonuclease PH